MATRSDFTDDEWEAMQKGVTGAGALVSVSDRDFTDTFGEASALAKALAGYREQSDSVVIRELASARGAGFGLTDSPQEMEAKTLAALQSALETLVAKAPDEAERYREFVLGVANAVAEAKGGLSDKEAQALGRIKGALDTA